MSQYAELPCTRRQSAEILRDVRRDSAERRQLLRRVSERRSKTADSRCPEAVVVGRVGAGHL